MTNGIIIHQTGGPEVMQWESFDVPPPKAGEVLLQHTAVGINFIDIYFRTGLYPAPHLPFTPGLEAAGIVLELGEGVEHLNKGDRVAYAGGAIGAYCEQRSMDASRLIKIPDHINDETAAAMMLKGMTAQYLLRQTYDVKAGDTILFHAAAGGVGLIAGQWAKHLGATVIGTAGSAEKVELAKQNGYDHVINYREESFSEQVLEITNGKKCDVVYDSVGKDTFPDSLDCLKQRGLWVSFGQSSGPLPEVNLGILVQKGSLFATRPTLFNYTDTRESLVNTANDLFEIVESGKVNIAIHEKFPLKEAQQAHKSLEGRATVGANLLIP